MVQKKIIFLFLFLVSPIFAQTYIDSTLVSIEGPYYPSFNIFNTTQITSELGTFNITILSINKTYDVLPTITIKYSLVGEPPICFVWGYDLDLGKYGPNIAYIDGVQQSADGFILPSGTHELKILVGSADPSIAIPLAYLECIAPAKYYTNIPGVYRKPITSVGTTSNTTYPYKMYFANAVPIKIIAPVDTLLTNVVIPITIPTKDYGIINCDSVMFTVYDELNNTEIPIPFYVDLLTCGTNNTIYYLKLPKYLISKDTLLYFYYNSDSPYSLSDPYKTFSLFVSWSYGKQDLNKLIFYKSNMSEAYVGYGNLIVNIPAQNSVLVIYNK